MASFPINLDVTDVMRKLRRLENKAPEVVTETLNRALTSIARRFTADFTRERLRGGGAEGVNVRTGNLRRSLGFTVQGRTLNDLVAFMGFGQPAHPWSGKADLYGPIHEFGGTIAAVNSEFLAIPIADNLTGTGVARIDSPLDLGQPVFIPWFGDTFLVFDSGRLMFKLQREVEIPARLNFFDDWEAFIDQGIAMLQDALSKALDKAERRLG